MHLLKRKAWIYLTFFCSMHAHLVREVVSTYGLGCCTRTFWPYLLPCRRGNKLEGLGTRVASSDKYSRAYEILV